MAFCNCDAEPELRISPCETHQAAEYAVWLAKCAPRLAAAQTAGDPFPDRDYWPADAEDIPEFQAVRAALSDTARRHFDEEWRLEAEMASWPSTWETALAIRDDWPGLVPRIERDAARMRLARDCSGEEYPLGGNHEEFLVGEATPEDLRAEADALATLAWHALLAERMLRDHADGAAKPVEHYTRFTAGAGDPDTVRALLDAARQETP